METVFHTARAALHRKHSIVNTACVGKDALLKGKGQIGRATADKIGQKQEKKKKVKLGNITGLSTSGSGVALSAFTTDLLTQLLL